MSLFVRRSRGRSIREKSAAHVRIRSYDPKRWRSVWAQQNGTETQTSHRQHSRLRIWPLSDDSSAAAEIVLTARYRAFPLTKLFRTPVVDLRRDGSARGPERVQHKSDQLFVH